MRYLGIVVLFAVLAGCTEQQHQGAADTATQVKTYVDETRKVLASDTAKVVAEAIGKLPIPGAQVVPVARDKVEWGLGIASGLLALFAGWQTKKAAEERSKKKAYKANSTQAELDAANKVIYGDAFRQDLSK